MCELTACELTGKVTDSEVMSCCSISIAPFEVQFEKTDQVDDIQRSIINDTQKRLNKNQKKKLRRARKKEDLGEDQDELRDMLHKYGLRNRVVVLSDDPTQMQKTVNQAVQLVN